MPRQVLDGSRASQATHPLTRWVLFHDEGMATAFQASHLSRRGLGEGGSDAPSDALGLVSRRGGGDGIPALHLSRRGLGEGESDAASGFGRLLPKWRSVSQVPNSRPPTHPQFRYRTSFFSLTSKLNHWSRALIHFLVAAPPGRGHNAD